MQLTVNNFIQKNNHTTKHLKLFDRILKQNIYELKREEINSMGYSLWSLESALWCFLNTDNYEDTVLTAVNLGGDTDTTAAIAGAAAGMYRGFDAIPEKWVKKLIKTEEINSLADRFLKRINSKIPVNT